MIRAAAKNHAGMAVVVDPGGYGETLEAVRAGGFDDDQRAPAGGRRVRAHRRVRHGDRDLDGRASSPRTRSGGPGTPGSRWSARAVLRYGENPHQRAALYVDPSVAGGLASARQLTARRCRSTTTWTPTPRTGWCRDFADPAVAVVEHANPCGIAVGSPDAADAVADAHRKANACDPVSPRSAG